MLSKNQVKLIQKLQQKKYRNELNLFIVEGKKSIVEFLQAGYRLELLIATEVFATALNGQPITLVSKEELRKVSSLKNPDEGLAIFHQRQHKGILQEGVILALDNVQDPGNLGTLIRLCDWFGIETLICNSQTVDCYNPKVVQASMGSLTRVAVHYVDLAGFLATCTLPLYAMDLDGENLYTTEFPEDCVLILGNEANGISPEVRALTDGIITIPRFGKLQQTESLNVAMAGAIVVSQVRKLENEKMRE
ncbi:RNA methyltransferase, TrmH family [Capnocytophaga sp. oral taxon 412 str. F0487]|uniref:TrmH family RNA methyltransferase n=1 Tax=Capnocytophaga sp. oral taxon 412 TaxID=712218 RepID=UPI0002696761|nr:RNA methyltransferase [Capnocytophaga sp. oral taxon 412]EIW91885.1 RNA methyltransferase, TrmH family [Capnocytophaga sp. oral taxon 412 str. F0487]